MVNKWRSAFDGQGVNFDGGDPFSKEWTCSGYRWRSVNCRRGANNRAANILGYITSPGAKLPRRSGTRVRTCCVPYSNRTAWVIILLHLIMAGSFQLKGLAATILVLYYDVSVLRFPTVFTTIQNLKATPTNCRERLKKSWVWFLDSLIPGKPPYGERARYGRYPFSTVNTKHVQVRLNLNKGWALFKHQELKTFEHSEL